MLIYFLNTSLSTFNSENKSRSSISEYSLNLKNFSRLIQYFFNSSSSKALIFLESNKKQKIISYCKNCSNRVSIELIDWSNMYKKYSIWKDSSGECVISLLIFSSKYKLYINFNNIFVERKEVGCKIDHLYSVYVLNNFFSKLLSAVATVTKIVNKILYAM